MGHSASVQPTRITSATSSRPAAVVSSSSRAQSSPTLRKGRRKDATCRNRRDLVRCRNDPSGTICESEKPKTDSVTNTLSSDVKLSSEVIVSNSFTFVAQVICISLSLVI